MNEEEKCSPVSINDFTIRDNLSDRSFVRMGQNRVAFCYRQYVINYLASTEVRFSEWHEEKREKEIKKTQENLWKEDGIDESLVNVVVKWQNGSFTFFPSVRNNVHAVFWVVDSVEFPCVDGCFISVSTYAENINDGWQDPWGIDTENCNFIPGKEFFSWRDADGR